MAQKIISVACYIIAGFFLYGVCFIGFLNLPPYAMKIAVMGCFSIPGLIALVIGLAVKRFLTWKRDTGIVLLSAAGLTAVVTFTTFCVFLSPEVKKTYPDIELSFFNDYITGLSCTILFAFVGIFLIRKSKKVF